MSRDYKWVNGDTVKYENWGKGSPGSPGTEHCAEIVDYPGFNGVWNDNTCDARNKNFICEKGLFFLRYVRFIHLL